jgi:hypothetical protein
MAVRSARRGEDGKFPQMFSDLYNLTPNVKAGETYPDVSEKLDSELMEGHAPLVYRGTEIVPAADYHFGKGEPIAVYLEIYETLLTTSKPPKVSLTVKIMDNKTGQPTMDLNINQTEGAFLAIRSFPWLFIFPSTNLTPARISSHCAL